MRKTSVYACGMRSYKLFINSVVYPHPSLNIAGLGTNPVFTTSLYDHTAQVCAQRFLDFNGLVFRLITTIHRTNNDYNKGE